MTAMRMMSRTCRTMVAVVLLAGTPALAAPAARLAPDHAPSSVLAWQGEYRWQLQVGDEGGALQLGFIQTPAGDYQLHGTLQLDDAELGVSGTGRWRSGKLILDLILVGAVWDVAPDPGKRQLYPQDRIPSVVDSVGFAMLRAELDGATLGGRTVQYQTNVVTGDRLEGPVLRRGWLEHVPAQ